MGSEYPPHGSHARDAGAPVNGAPDLPEETGWFLRRQTRQTVNSINRLKPLPPPLSLVKCGRMKAFAATVLLAASWSSSAGSTVAVIGALPAFAACRTRVSSHVSVAADQQLSLEMASRRNGHCCAGRKRK